MKESEEIITTNTDPSAWSHLAKAPMFCLLLSTNGDYRSGTLTSGGLH